MTTVTHGNFNDTLKSVEAGQATFYIATYTHLTRITANTIAKFRAAGLEVIKKSADGTGFRLARGRKTEYVLPGYLKAEFIK